MCGGGGGRVERMPWVEGKPQLPEAYSWFLAEWAKRLSWKDVAEAFRTPWDHVFCSVDRVGTWGRAHQDLSGVQALGVDEIAWPRGHRYLTRVYPIARHGKRRLWGGEQRTVNPLVRCFRWFGTARSQALGFVWSAMWKPDMNVLAQKAGSARHLLDRFHIMAPRSKAIDEVRAPGNERAESQGGRTPPDENPRALTEATGEPDGPAGE